MIVGAGPLGLRLRGRTSRLAWTRRLALVGLLTLVLEGLGIAAGALSGGLRQAVLAAAAAAVAVPLLVDVALIVLAPLEDLLARRYVRRASDVLRRVQPLVVGITGSYGKTTTKGYTAHLVAGERSVVASPRSFNNRAGLARTVNEHLAAGTEVLLAEMGAYGPGEIAALCSWLHPEVAVITAIGPSHLERFGSLDTHPRSEGRDHSKAPASSSSTSTTTDSRGSRDGSAATKKVLRASGSEADADVAVLSA